MASAATAPTDPRCQSTSTATSPASCASAKSATRPAESRASGSNARTGTAAEIKNTKGVETSFLYRADELAKAIADGLEIIAVEGEKDADNLWRLGFAATCNAHGASAPGKAPKWKKKHTDQLTGGAIVVLNDHDAPGARAGRLRAIYRRREKRQAPQSC